MHLTAVTSVLVLGMQAVGGQAVEPMVIYGFAVLDDGDSTFIRLEIEVEHAASAVRLAPFGTRPLAFQDVEITSDTSTLRWTWPGRTFARCRLGRVAEYHWEGGCHRGDEERRIRLGGGYVPDLGQDLPVLPVDLAILDRALARLSSPATWNRADDRVCEDDVSGGRWSLFCALFAASVEVDGRYLHNRPSMNAARSVIVETAADRIHAHTLRDFNNHRQTTFDQVRGILQAARARLAAGGR